MFVTVKPIGVRFEIRLNATLIVSYFPHRERNAGIMVQGEEEPRYVEESVEDLDRKIGIALSGGLRRAA